MSKQGKTSAVINQLLLMLIYANSSRLRNLDLFIANLHFNSLAPLPIFITSDMPSYMLNKEHVETMIKSNLKNGFEYVEHLEKLALENRDKRAEFEKKLDALLSGPIPEDDYRAVCEEYPVSREQYAAAERTAGLFLLPNSWLTIHASFLLRPQPMQARIPEPIVLRWIDDIRRELAAQGQPKN